MESHKSHVPVTTNQIPSRRHVFSPPPGNIENPTCPERGARETNARVVPPVFITKLLICTPSMANLTPLQAVAWHKSPFIYLGKL
jgi:hypothetical protein